MAGRWPGYACIVRRIMNKQPLHIVDMQGLLYLFAAVYFEKRSSQEDLFGWKMETEPISILRYVSICSGVIGIHRSLLRSGVPAPHFISYALIQR